MRPKSRPPVFRTFWGALEKAKENETRGDRRLVAQAVAEYLFDAEMGAADPNEVRTVLREPRFIGMMPGDREHILVAALGDPPEVPNGLFKVNVRTGKLTALDDNQKLPGTILYDRQAQPRILHAGDRQSAFRPFLYRRPGKWTEGWTRMEKLSSEVVALNLSPPLKIIWRTFVPTRSGSGPAAAVFRIKCRTRHLWDLYFEPDYRSAYGSNGGRCALRYD